MSNGKKAAEAATQEKVATVVAADAEVMDDANGGSPTTAVAVREDTVPAGGLGVFACEGGPTVLDWTWVHLKFEMSQKRPDGNQGEFYLGRDWEAKLCDKGGSLGVGQMPDPKRRFEFVVVGRKDGYKHYVTQQEFASGIMAKRYYVDPSKGAKGWQLARQAALDAGETIGDSAWRDGDPAKGEPRRVGPSASEFMQLMVLVKKPEDLDAGHELFSVPLAGEFYAPAYFEFDKLNWRKAYGCMQAVISAEVNRRRVDPKYEPCIFDKVFWGYSAAVNRNGKVVTTPMMTRAVVDGKPLSLPKEAIEDLRAVVQGAAAAPDDAEF